MTTSLFFHSLLVFVMSSVCCFAGTYTTFPAGSCRPQSCATHNPYELVPVGGLNEKSKNICFRIDFKGCDGDDHECCSTLTRVLEKIAIKVRPSCGRASYTEVTIDGVRKGGGVYFDENLGFSELRVTSLRWNASTGVGKTICVNGLRAPCPDAHSFCGDEGCIYSVYDPFTHRCCPTCPFEDISPLPPAPLSPSLPSPLPPAPLSPSPPRPILLSPNSVPPLSPPPPRPLQLSPSLSPSIAKIVVKMPLTETRVNDGLINVLCDELEQAVYTLLSYDQGGLLCKELLKSTTGIYYGIVRIELSVESDKRKLITALQQGRMANFTSLANLKCGSTVVLTTPPDDYKLRYTASAQTCIPVS